jgi:hypothetical protein
VYDIIHDVFWVLPLYFMKKMNYNGYLDIYDMRIDLLMIFSGQHIVYLTNVEMQCYLLFKQNTAKKTTNSFRTLLHFEEQ